MNRFWNFRNEAGRVPELLVYGDIDDFWGDVQSKEFVEQLSAITAKELHVRINSLGGSVFAAQAIYSSLRRHPANVTVFIDGIAASAATLIAMAGDKIVMPNNAMMMIHNPLTWTAGDAEGLREMADVLDKVRDTIVATYREKTELEDAKIIELMDAETWMTASEALELGFVDEVSPAMEIAAKAGKNGALIVNGLTFDESRRRRMPEGWLARVEIENTNDPVYDSPGEEVEDMTLEELRENHPEIYNAISEAARNEGVQQERERIRNIEEMAMPGHEDLVIKAKFETGVSPEAFAMEIIKAEKAAKQGFLEARARDAEPLKNVAPSIAGDQLESEDDKRKPIINASVEAFNRKNGHAAN